MLRTEKGFIGVGHDTDGTVTPDDLGMAWLVGRNKADFIGKRSLARPDTRRGDPASARRNPCRRAASRPAGGRPDRGRRRAGRGRSLDGVVTTSFFSPTLERSIALALLRRGRERHGERVAVPLEGRTVMAAVVSPVFFDPGGRAHPMLDLTLRHRALAHLDARHCR